MDRDGDLFLCEDKKITFDNPDLSTYKQGKTVKVKLFLDGDKDQPTTESSEKPLQ